LFITTSKSWVQEVLNVVSLGITSNSGTSWKKKGGVTGANQKWTRGLLIKTKGNVVGGMWISGGVDGFAFADLSG
jgi:hypothetical protein